MCYGPEFVAKAVQEWIAAVGAKTAYIERGSPWENGYVESFNARLRDELLDGEIFYSLQEAKVVIESWRPWIMMRSATDLSKADLHVFSKLFDDGLERGQEAEAFSWRQIGGHDDVLDFFVGHLINVGMTRQPAP